MILSQHVALFTFSIPWLLGGWALRLRLFHALAGEWAEFPVLLVYNIFDLDSAINPAPAVTISVGK
jgi:hypothetical protein